MTEPVEEAYELVEDGLIGEREFRELMFLNPARLHAGMNPAFFDGTVCERAVRSLARHLTRRVSSSGRSNRSGWAIAASASTPSTTRGPGRTNAASASTAHTVTPSGSAPESTSVAGSRARIVELVTARRDDDHIGCARMKFLGGDATRPLTTHPEHRLRAGGGDEIGDPVPGAVQRIDPLQHRDAWRNRVAVSKAAIDVNRRRRSRPSASARSSQSVAFPITTIDSSTSSSVIGSTVSTSALHPKCRSVSSTSVTSTADTADRSWVTTRSAESSRSVPSSRWYRSSPAACVHEPRHRSAPASVRPAMSCSTRRDQFAPPADSRTRR